MEKEYKLLKIRYIEGQRSEEVVYVSWSRELVQRRYNELNVKRLWRKRYTLEIQERNCGDWQNVDINQIFSDFKTVLI